MPELSFPEQQNRAQGKGKKEAVSYCDFCVSGMQLIYDEGGRAELRVLLAEQFGCMGRMDHASSGTPKLQWQGKGWTLPF